MLDCALIWHCTVASPQARSSQGSWRCEQEGRAQDSQFCCVDSVVHKDAGGAEDSSFLSTSLVHSYLTLTACGMQLMKL